MAKFKRVPLVYLAGGMRSNWQDEVKAAIGGSALLIDPRNHGSRDEEVYTAWDLSGVDAADIVFGYIEKDNPNGAGLALEFGVAHAQGKPLIYVEEPGFEFSRYFGMVRAVSDRQLTSLDDGISVLKDYIKQWCSDINTA